MPRLVSETSPTMKHIALVGWPKSGKSTVATILREEFGGIVVDDGFILRQAFSALTGVPLDDCLTQEGKQKTYQLGNRPEIVRQGLGELGNWVEARYGPDFIPERAIELAEEVWSKAPFFIYPSVRREQGKVYQKAGGIVIEVFNPTVSASENEFDQWDQTTVDEILLNNPNTMDLDFLRQYVIKRFEYITSCRKDNLVPKSFSVYK